jgi:hypothetical protein
MTSGVDSLERSEASWKEKASFRLPTLLALIDFSGLKRVFA